MAALSALDLYHAVDGARIEGRLENPIQRLREIQKLHEAVRLSVPDLTTTLKPNGRDRSEVDILSEFNFTLQTIRDVSQHINFPKTLDDERLPQKGKDNLSRCRPLGTMLILADEHFPLARSILPLVYAIAAGNAPILILSPSYKSFAEALRHALSKAMPDLEAIGVLAPTSEEDKRAILKALAEQRFHGIFYQNVSDRDLLHEHGFFEPGPNKAIVSGVPGSGLAVLTRHADLKKAGEDIARVLANTFTDRHTVVLIDESVFDDFLEVFRDFAYPTSTVRPASSSTTVNGRIKNLGPGIRASEEWQVGPTTKVTVLRDADKMDDIFSDTPLMSPSGTPVLMCSISSMDAAISLANKSSLYLPNSGYPSLHLYGNPSEVRYLSLFIDSSVTYINQFSAVSYLAPWPLLQLSSILSSVYARPSPLYTTDVERWPVNMKRSVQITQPERYVQRLKACVQSEKLEPPKQDLGKRMGFFPQGGLVGLSHALFVSFAIGTAAIWLTRWYSQKSH